MNIPQNLPTVFILENLIKKLKRNEGARFIPDAREGLMDRSLLWTLQSLIKMMKNHGWSVERKDKDYTYITEYVFVPPTVGETNES